ncbi:MAG: glycine betaine ABC transporter substrate-binding protein, partial [Chloroflexota bacterium]
GWYVPRYVIEGDSDRGIEAMAPDLQSVQDLERYREVFASDQRPGTGQLMDGSPGWFSYKIDCMKLKAYRLDDSYAQVTSGSESALFSALEEAHEAGEPILTYVFEPTWPMAQFDLVKLEEPPYDPQQWEEDKGVAFPDSQIKKLVYRDFRERAPDVTEFLEQVSLSTDRINEILLTMHEEDMEPQEAARQWLQENTDTWTSWVPDDVAERVEEQLQ